MMRISVAMSLCGGDLIPLHTNMDWNKYLSWLLQKNHTTKMSDFRTPPPKMENYCKAVCFAFCAMNPDAARRFAHNGLYILAVPELKLAKADSLEIALRIRDGLLENTSINLISWMILSFRPPCVIIHDIFLLKPH